MLISRASPVIDLLALSTLLITLLFSTSIYMVRKKKRYRLHKYLQTTCTCLLLLVLLVFEAEIHLRGWRAQAQASPLYDKLSYLLYPHIGLATCTTVLWLYVFISALKNFPNPPSPNKYSGTHRRLGHIIAVILYLTAISGLSFYWLAFVI